MVLEGTRGASYLGDIAVDDISISNGTCSQGNNLINLVTSRYLNRHILFTEN